MAPSDPGSHLSVSVVIPADRGWDTLPGVLEALGPQVQSPSREAVLVDYSGERRAAQLEERFPWLKVVALDEPGAPGRARNYGASLSQGEYLAFLDADTVPSEHWLDELERAITEAWDAVASPIVNGTPWHPVGTSGYLLEFAEWLPRRRRMPRHGAASSLLVRRQYLEEVGGFDENIPLGDETLLTYPLAQRGRLGWAGRARVTHLNPTTLQQLLDRQLELGASFVTLADRLDFPYSGVTRRWALPFAPLLRLASLARSLKGSPTEAVQSLLYLPVILLGLVWWARGVARARRGPRRQPSDNRPANK